MATGLSNIAVTPGPRKKGPKVVAKPEAASQTAPKGAVGVMTGGYFTKCSAGVPTSIYGFFRVAGQNGATAGAKTSSIYRAEQGEPFIAQLEGAWAATLEDAPADLTVNADGSCYIDATGPVTNNVRIKGLAPNFTTSDTNAAVYFVINDANIQA